MRRTARTMFSFSASAPEPRRAKGRESHGQQGQHQQLRRDHGNHTVVAEHVHLPQVHFGHAVHHARIAELIEGIVRSRRPVFRIEPLEQ